MISRSSDMRLDQHPVPASTIVFMGALLKPRAIVVGSLS